jgi:hypothetical protein
MTSLPLAFSKWGVRKKSLFNSPIMKKVPYSLLVAGMLLPLSLLQGVILDSPNIVGGSTEFPEGNGLTWYRSNVFNGTNATFASLAEGTDTFLEFQFGSTVSFDRVVMINRASTANGDRFSSVTLTYDSGSDTLDTSVAASYSNGTSAGSSIYSLGSRVTTQSVRWDVNTIIGNEHNNTGMMEMFFLDTPNGAQVHDSVSVINVTTPFSASYSGDNAVDGVVGMAGPPGSAGEYASLGGGNSTFIDFDLEATVSLVGFDFFDRFFAGDQTSSYRVTVADNSDFSDPSLQETYAKTGAADSREFNAVEGRYVRLELLETGSSLSNSGVNEIIFYTAVPEPALSTLLAALAAAAALRLRRRQR